MLSKIWLKIMSKVVLLLEFILIFSGIYFGLTGFLILLFFVIFLAYIKVGNDIIDEEENQTEK